MGQTTFPSTGDCWISEPSTVDGFSLDDKHQLLQLAARHSASSRHLGQLCSTKSGPLAPNVQLDSIPPWSQRWAPHLHQVIHRKNMEKTNLFFFPHPKNPIWVSSCVPWMCVWDLKKSILICTFWAPPYRSILQVSAPRSVTSCHVSPLGTKHLRMSANVVTGQPQLAEMVWNVGTSTVMKGPMVFHFFWPQWGAANQKWCLHVKCKQVAIDALHLRRQIQKGWHTAYPASNSTVIFAIQFPLC